MKKKTLLRLVMVCLLLGCGVSGIKAQITIDKLSLIHISEPTRPY